MSPLGFPSIVPQFSAQLASPASNMTRFANRGDSTVFEEKFDGIRAMVVFQPNHTIEVRNRHGENKLRGNKNPWLIDALTAWADQTPELWFGTCLDGELVADTWNQTMHQLAHGGDGLRFVVFDLPFCFGEDIRTERWSDRRMALVKLFESRPVEMIDDDPAKERITVSQLLHYSDALASQIWERGGEGVIAKDAAARYEPGGRHFWFKIKQVQTADAWICGFTKGGGKYADTIGAVKLCQFKDGKETVVTQISGMTDKQRRSFSDADLGRVVEFEYHQRTAGSYRHPRWLTWRDDKSKDECLWEATEPNE